MSKAVDIIVESFVNKAVRNGLIYPSHSHPTPDSWKQDLQQALNTYPAAKARKEAQHWYNSLVAAQTKSRYGRQMDLVEMTSPNMIGFFPEYDPNATHSNFAITMFDTETADKNTDIIETAGFKLIYNKDAKRFERLPNASVSNSQFYGVYNPKDASYVQTEQVHGRNSHTIVSLDGRIPTGWGTEQLNQFLEFSKGTVLSGHNIMNADLSWIYNRPTEGFKFIEPEFKQGILDTLHLAAALLGRGKPGEGRNALQNLAQKFNVNAELPGLPAHAGWADTIKNVKVLEHLLSMAPNHPAVREFIEAMDLGNRHSHYLENPDPLHNSGFVTHGINQKASPLGIVGHALNKLKVKAKETILKDIPAALGIAREDYYNGNWDKSSYEEMSMAGTDESIKEDMKYIAEHMGTGGHMTLEMQEAIRDIAANAHWGKAAARSQLLRDIKGLSEDDATYMIRNRGFRSEQDRLMREKTILEQRDLAREDASNYRGLNRRVGAFLNRSVAQGWRDETWFQDLRQQHKDKSLNELDFARAQEAKKAAEDKASTWSDFMSWTKAEGATASRKYSEQKRAERNQEIEQQHRYKRFQQQEYFDALMERGAEYRRLDAQKMEAAKAGLLSKGDLATLDVKAAEGTKAYREELEKLVTTNKKALNVARAFNGSQKFYDPMRLYEAINNQASGIKHAAHGILPLALEKPIFRFGEALGNVWSQFGSTARTRLSQAADIGNAMSAIGSAMMVGGTAATATGAGAIPGTVLNMAGGLLKLSSNLIGKEAENQINQYGEGIQHRLNLIGMTASALGAFINGLKMCVNLFGKLSSIWSYMPSYTMSTLTGIEWSKASGMSANDRLLGFKDGTLNTMYTNLAYQQADLYTSGKYDETKLVASARLGIFDLAYAPPGGDIEQQQADIYDRLYKNIYESGLSKGDIQQQLSLVKDFSPEMAAMLERGHGMVEAGYTQYRDYKAFQSMYGYNSLSTNENAKVSYTSTRWGAAHLSFTQGMSLAGSRAYDFLDELIIKPINNVLWSYARTGKIDWEAITKILNDLIDQLDKVDLKGVNWDKLLKLFDPLGKKLTDKLKGILEPIGEFITRMGLTKIEFHPEKLLGFLTGKNDLGDVFKLTTPETIAEEKAADVTRNMTTTAETAAAYGMREMNKEFLERQKYDLPVVASSLSRDEAQARWEDAAEAIYQAVGEDTSKWRMLKSVAGKYVLQSDTDLLKSHDIAQWDAQGMSRVINLAGASSLANKIVEESGGAISAEESATFVQHLLKQELSKEFEAANATGQAAELAGSSLLAVLRNLAASIDKDKKITLYMDGEKIQNSAAKNAK